MTKNSAQGPPETFVLDGAQRSSLAVTRSLGTKGIPVAVGETKGRSLASCSKYCTGTFSYPDPYGDSEAFVSAIVRLTSGRGPVVLLPTTDVTLGEVLRHREQFSDDVIVPFVRLEKYLAASDKASLFLLAERLGVPTPITALPPSSPSGAAGPGAVPGSIGFPLVVKPARSRVFNAGRWVETGVRYARDRKTLDAYLAEGIGGICPILLQERIEGPGVGIFLLMKDGEAIARFAHRRIREKPPSGGVSVLCESIEPPPDALDSATKLLRELNWTGVAMVEFKRDRRDGLHKLIEVNARFWGSLQLAISSGVDFPFLLYRMSLGETVRGPERYQVGLRSRWELGDLDHLLIRLRHRRDDLFLPADAPSRGTVVARFISDFFRPCVRGEVLRPGDPGPFLFELREYVRHLAGRS